MIIKILLIFTFFSLVQLRITWEKGLQSTQITASDIRSFSQVMVEAFFNYQDNDRYEKLYLVVRSQNKHKRQAYMDLLKKYGSIVNTLVKAKAIPNKSSMIESIVHRNFHKKTRKWEFYRYFVIYALKEQIQEIKYKLNRYKPEIIKSHTVINYLNEKYMTIAAFLEAKLELQKFIKDHLNDEYRILLTKDIQIIGDGIKNEQLIQNQVEDEFNSYSGSQIEKQISSGEVELRNYYYEQPPTQIPKKLIIKVLFQIVEKSADIEDILEGIEDNEIESHSISDFQQGILQQNWKDYETKQENNEKQEGEDDL